MKTITCVVLILCLGLSGMAMARGGPGAGGGAGGAAAGGGAGAGGGLSASSYSAFYRYRADYHHHRHARQFAHNNHDKGGRVKKKNVAYGYNIARQDAKAEHFDSTHQSQSVSPETFIKEIPDDRTYTLSPGMPLLGLDPRSPRTWALYNEMLPFIFSEAPAPSFDAISSPQRREGETGM